MELIKTSYFSICHVFENSNFRVIEWSVDGTVKEQRLRTKNVNAKKVNTYGKNPGG
jgi:hypothetical protein